MRCTRILPLLLLSLLAPGVQALPVASRTLLLDATQAGEAIVAVGERGTILRSVDQARTWVTAQNPSAAALTGVSFGDAQHGWAVGHDAIILATTDGGVSWTRQWQGENLSDSFLDVLALDATHVIAVGAYGLCLKTTDAGRTWTRQRILEDDYHLNHLTRGPTGTLYLAGEHGTLLRSTDRGTTWSPIPTPYDGSFYGILPLGERRILAYGLRGRVYRSEDDGGTWQLVTTPEPVLLATGVQTTSGAILLAGGARGLVVATGAGGEFSRRDVGVATGIAELLLLPGEALLAVGEAGAIRLEAAQIQSAITPAGAPTSAHPQR